MLNRSQSDETRSLAAGRYRPHPDAAGLDRADRARPPARGGVFSPERIASLFRSWEKQTGILLAVSGGPDSVALMLLAARWARDLRSPLLRVATVDHGLRADSRDEAIAVSRWAAELSLPHVTLVWEGPKPRSRIQERAREARYGLLFGHAAAIGADCLATAHHADDQAETILFRLLRGSGPAGLAGMAPETPRDGLLHSRPLLGCRKTELVDFCVANSHPFFDDPSNRDPRFARTRIRDLAGSLARHGLDCESLARLGHRAARAEAALAMRAEAVRMSLPAIRTPDGFSADLTDLLAEPDEIFLRILTFEIKALNRGRPIRLDRLERLTTDLRNALHEGAAASATLGGTLLKLDCDRRLTIVHERRRDPIRRTATV